MEVARIALPSPIGPTVLKLIALIETLFNRVWSLVEMTFLIFGRYGASFGLAQAT